MEKVSNRRIDLNGDFAGILQEHIDTSLYSYGQIAQLSGVPKRTIVNWLDGTVKYPRNWQSVVRVAAALRQPRNQTDELLIAAHLPDLQSLNCQKQEPQDRMLLERWKLEAHENGAHTPCLYHYLRELSTELARFPAYFPRKTAFTFASIYQDLRLRPLVSSSTDEIGQFTTEGELWPLLRQQTKRAVILGQPGMGKTWLVKSEAIKLAQEALESYGLGELQALPLLIRVPDLVTLIKEHCTLEAIYQAIAVLAARLTPSLPEAELVSALRSFMEQKPEKVVFLLDAVDEVTARDGLRNVARRLVIQLASATPARILLTSRTLGYATAPLGRYLGPDVTELEIVPFGDQEITRVMRAWFHDREELLDRLQFAMRRAPAIVRQASNPLLLSLICMLNETRGDKLDGNRSALYEPVLRLLLEGRWRSFEMQLPESRVRCKLRLLESIAWCYATHQQNWWEHLPGEVIEQICDRLPDAHRLTATWHAEWGTPYEGPLWELSEWDGILTKGFIPADGAASAVPYSFLHRTFQEFLVSSYLLRRYSESGFNAPEIQLFLTSKASAPEWIVVLLLLAEQLSFQPLPTAKPLLNQLLGILLEPQEDPSGQLAVAASEILLKMHGVDLGVEVVKSLRERLLLMMRNEQVSTLSRVHAARLVADLGDPRPGVMELDKIEFVPIPAGTFLMGSDPGVDSGASSDEFPQHLCATQKYAISRFPIGNAQYRHFLDDKVDGYDNPAYWQEAIAFGHWQDGLVWRLRPHCLSDGTFQWEPKWSREPDQSGWPNDLPNGPIMGISWYEARAFARWLEKRWQWQGVIESTTRLDIPNEVEWEKATRGEDGRIHPWGNDFDSNRLNCYGHMLMAPVPIGTFPNSVSPYGVEEMVGNFWEWTRSLFEPYGESYQSESDNLGEAADGVTIAIRGGAHISRPKRCRYAARGQALPYGRRNATFRIVKYDR